MKKAKNNNNDIFEIEKFRQMKKRKLREHFSKKSDLEYVWVLKNY